MKWFFLALHFFQPLDKHKSFNRYIHIFSVASGPRFLILCEWSKWKLHESFWIGHLQLYYVLSAKRRRIASRVETVQASCMSLCILLNHSASTFALAVFPSFSFLPVSRRVLAITHKVTNTKEHLVDRCRCFPAPYWSENSDQTFSFPNSCPDKGSVNIREQQTPS